MGKHIMMHTLYLSCLCKKPGTKPSLEYIIPGKKLPDPVPVQLRKN